MCILTVAVNAHEDFPLVLLHNRDEYYDRTATELTQREDILGAFDELSGGTWMGVNVHTGRFAALTNVRSRERECDGPARRSRGELVMRVLRGDDAATDPTTQSYTNYNLLHGSVCKACGRADLDFTACTPPEWVPHTMKTVGCGCGRASSDAVPRPMVLSKSNDHGGLWTRSDTINVEAPSEVDSSDACVWAKVAWLRDRCERMITSPSVGLLAGEKGAHELVDALAPLMSTPVLPPGPMADRAASATPSQWSNLSSEEERSLHRAPFLSKCKLHENGRDGADPTYGTVSQTVLIYCRSERAILYAYRETAARPAAADDAEGSASHLHHQSRIRGCEGPSLHGGEYAPWSWRRFQYEP
jgi:hypothetical protein